MVKSDVQILKYTLDISENSTTKNNPGYEISADSIINLFTDDMNVATGNFFVSGDGRRAICQTMVKVNK